MVPTAVPAAAADGAHARGRSCPSPRRPRPPCPRQAPLSARRTWAARASTCSTPRAPSGRRSPRRPRAFFPSRRSANDPKQLRLDYERLRITWELTRDIGLERDLDVLLDKILLALFKFTKADRGVILLRENDGTLHPRAARRRDGTTAAIQVSSTILNHVITERMGVLTHDASMDFAASKGKSMILNRISSAMVVPLLHENEKEVLGVVWLDSESLAQFQPKDLELITSVAGQAAMFIENTILAKKVEQEILVRDRFQRLVAPNVAEQMISGKLEVKKGGQLVQELTIYNSDIRGFTRHERGNVRRDARRDAQRVLRADGRDPLQVRGHARQVHGRRDHGVLGRAARAPRRRRPLRAVRARPDGGPRAVQPRAHRGRASPRSPWASGIHTGPGVVGYVGSSKALSYTTIGDTANTSARLCSSAASGQIVISETTLSQARRPLRVRGDRAALAQGQGEADAPVQHPAREGQRRRARGRSGLTAARPDAHVVTASHVLPFEKPVVELVARVRELRELARTDRALEPELRRLEDKATKLARELFAELTPWQKVQLSRHPNRPYTLDYIDAHLRRILRAPRRPHASATTPRLSPASRGCAGARSSSSATRRAAGPRSNVKRNFGMPHPEGYRKALRLYELASRFGLPILTLIDTPGAYPGIGAEERGQSEAIGACLAAMARARVPIVTTIIGEGGSGGALALGVANRVLVLEFGTYSVITPEGCASILWKDGAKADEAAARMKMTAPDLLRLGVVDRDRRGAGGRRAPGPRRRGAARRGRHRPRARRARCERRPGRARRGPLPALPRDGRDRRLSRRRRGRQFSSDTGISHDCASTRSAHEHVAVDVVVLLHGRTDRARRKGRRRHGRQPRHRRGHRAHLRGPRGPGRRRLAQARRRGRRRRVDREGARRRSHPGRGRAHGQGRRLRRASSRRRSPRFGKVDVLVNNAGTNPYFGPMLNADRRGLGQDLRRQPQGLLLVRARGRAPPARRATRPARSSTSPASRASSRRRMQGVYAMTKAAVISMTKTLALELGPSEIRVNAIAPGFVDTRLASAILKNDDLRQGRGRAHAARPLRHARTRLPVAPCISPATLRAS